MERYMNEKKRVVTVENDNIKVFLILYGNDALL